MSKNDMSQLVLQVSSGGPYADFLNSKYPPEKYLKGLLNSYTLPEAEELTIKKYDLDQNTKIELQIIIS